MEPKALLSNIILRTQVGSMAYGTALEGTQDNDQMAIGIEHPHSVLGLERSETYTYRPGRGPEDPSSPDDLDLVVHPLKKWMSLAMAANPSILVMLWAPVLEQNYYGELIRDNADKFISHHIFTTHMGYAKSQLKRLEDGKFYASRQKIVEAHGYDTKFASHAIRLLLQCIEITETNKLCIPIGDKDRRTILDVRQGKYSKDEFFDLFNTIMLEVEKKEKESTLRPDPSYAWANYFLQDVYENYYFLKNPEYNRVVDDQKIMEKYKMS